MRIAYQECNKYRKELLSIEKFTIKNEIVDYIIAPYNLLVVK